MWTSSMSQHTYWNHWDSFTIVKIRPRARGVTHAQLMLEPLRREDTA